MKRTASCHLGALTAMCGLKVVEGCSLQKGWSIMEKRYYIAYGSNLNLRQMKMRCPTAKVMGTAVIKNYELLFKGSLTGAYLTIEPKEVRFPLRSGPLLKQMKRHLIVMKATQSFIIKRIWNWRSKEYGQER